jgi:oligopeptide transport system substrate-binding protein
MSASRLSTHTLRFHMRQPVPFVPKLVSHQFFRPVPRKTVEQYGATWTQPGRIVVSGAFTIETWRPYDVLIMKRNPQYYDAALVKLDTLTFYPLEDITTMMNLYKAGEVDATYNHRALIVDPARPATRTTRTHPRSRPSPTCSTRSRVVDTR